MSTLSWKGSGRFSPFLEEKRSSTIPLGCSGGFLVPAEFLHQTITPFHHSRLKSLPVDLALLSLWQHLTLFFLDMVFHQFTKDLELRLNTSSLVLSFLSSLMRTWTRWCPSTASFIISSSAIFSRMAG